jgi:hypothetical protein
MHPEYSERMTSFSRESLDMIAIVERNKPRNLQQAALELMEYVSKVPDPLNVWLKPREIILRNLDALTYPDRGEEHDDDE